MNKTRKVPVGLEVGDNFEHPWGEFEIVDERGEYNNEDNREWYVRDTDTREELWVDWDFLMMITKASVYQ